MITLNLETKNGSQRRTKAFLEANVSEILADKINNGVKIEKDGKMLINKKDLDGFWAYACRKARENKDEYTEDETVFGWAIHYFEEDSIEGTLYNEDGTKYSKPLPKPVQRVPAPTVPAKPTPPKPQQFNLFDMMAQTEEPKTDSPVDELDNGNDGEFTLPVPEDIDDGDDEPTELNVDMETGEILSYKTAEKTVPAKQGAPLYQKYMS